jgi:nitrosocyanin
MNKYIVIGIVLVAIIAGGALFSKFDTSFACDETMGNDLSLTIRSLKNEWRFEPETVTVEQCDRVTLEIINEDDFDHGFAIDAFGISQRMPASETIDISFVASKSGEFPFYCSVSCGSGDVDGVDRGHFDHLGRFIISAFNGLVGISE